MKQSKLRLLIQFSFAAISNGYIKGFAKGKIFTGLTKYTSFPSMCLVFLLFLE